MRVMTLALAAVLCLAVTGCAPKQKEKTQAPPGARAAETNLPKLWDFWATWCAPCKEMKPTIEALGTEYAGRIEIRSIDVDQDKELAQGFKIQAVPTLVFLDAKGKELSRIIGLVPRDTIVARFRTHGFIQ